MQDISQKASPFSPAEFLHFTRALLPRFREFRLRAGVEHRFLGAPSSAS
jgi:hypothetical protein